MTLSTLIWCVSFQRPTFQVKFKKFQVKLKFLLGNIEKLDISVEKIRKHCECLDWFVSWYHVSGSFTTVQYLWSHPILTYYIQWWLEIGYAWYHEPVLWRWPRQGGQTFSNILQFVLFHQQPCSSMLGTPT